MKKAPYSILMLAARRDGADVVLTWNLLMVEADRDEEESQEGQTAT